MSDHRGDDAETEVLALSLRKFEWKVQRRWDEIEALFDDNLVFVHITGQTTSKREWLDELRSGRFAYEQIEPHDATVRIVGTAAMLTGRATFTVVFRGRPAVYRLIFTEIYRRTTDGWSLVVLHTTAC